MWPDQVEPLDEFNVGPMKSHKRYTVRHRETSSRRVESCYYAGDAFEARVMAMEAVPFIKAHPNSIEEIRCDDAKQG